MPGYLVPSDFPSIFKLLWLNTFQTIEDFLFRYFRASPGAIVIKDAEIIRIETIVPATHPLTNHCIFLDDKMKCIIHTVSPFACRMFDEHMTDEEANKRNQTGLQEIMNNSTYFHIWTLLNNEGLIAKPPEELRKGLKNE